MFFRGFGVVFRVFFGGLGRFSVLVFRAFQLSGLGSRGFWD